MSFFKNREGHDGEKGEVKTPKNQILQTPETQADRSKLDLYQNKTPEERKKINDRQAKIASEYSNRLKSPSNTNDGSASGSPNKGQRVKEKGHTTDMEG